MAEVEQEVLMHLRPQTTREKLLWERQSNKELVETIRILQNKVQTLENAITELTERMKKEQLGALIIKNNKLNKEIEDKNKKLKSYKKEIEELFINLARANEKLLMADKNIHKAT